MEDVTIAILQETGYKSWKDFYFQQISYGGINGVYSYGYVNSKNEESKINLPIQSAILKILVLEEAKLLLRYCKVNSFTELLENKTNLIRSSW